MADTKNGEFIVQGVPGTCQIAPSNNDFNEVLIICSLSIATTNRLDV